MKITYAIAFVCLVASSALHDASAACAADDPVAVAKAFYLKHPGFSSEDPAKIKTIVTPRFFEALDREYKCAQGQICAIEADPWTGAQDGEIGKPVEFAAISNSGTEASVSMSYLFVLDKTHREHKRANLLLQRKSSTDCWLIADLVGPRGESLVQNIEKWYKEYGSGL
jgi:hypothetical protein